MEYGRYFSPLGWITICLSDAHLVGLWPDGHKYAPKLDDSFKRIENGNSAAEHVYHWLDEYFAGKHPQASKLPFMLKGTAFQITIWNMLLEIPYGQTVTYGRLAEQCGRKMSAQAVGGAVGRNPISIIIPCHRVIGTKGRLVGYAGGLNKKEWLLHHEGIL